MKDIIKDMMSELRLLVIENNTESGMVESVKHYNIGKIDMLKKVIATLCDYEITNINLIKNEMYNMRVEE